jgi:hypothetical protein
MGAQNKVPTLSSTFPRLSRPCGHPDRNKSEQKTWGTKGTCKLGDGNMVKSLWGTRKERKTFQLSTETQIPPMSSSKSK